MKANGALSQLEKDVLDAASKFSVLLGNDPRSLGIDSGSLQDANPRAVLYTFHKERAVIIKVEDAGLQMGVNVPQQYAGVKIFPAGHVSELLGPFQKQFNDYLANEGII